MTAPPPCWGTSPPPWPIPAGKANRAAELPAPATLSRELALLALGEASWHGLSTVTGWPGRAVPACAGTASSWALPQPQTARITLDLCRFPH